MTANLRDVENIKVFYKTKELSSQTNFEDIDWVAFNDDGNPDVELLPIASNTISGDFEDQETYQEFVYSDDGIPDFSSFAIKVTMQTIDPAYIPKIQDIRAVASY